MQGYKVSFLKIMHDFKNSSFSPLALRSVIILLKTDCLQCRWFSEMLLISYWLITEWIAPFVNDTFLKDHTALCIFTVTCHPVFIITPTCFYGQHLLFQTCKYMENCCDATLTNAYLSLCSYQFFLTKYVIQFLENECCHQYGSTGLFLPNADGNKRIVSGIKGSTVSSK